MSHSPDDPATPQHTAITLPVTPEAVRTYCQGLQRQSRNAGQTLAQLAGPGQTQSPSYKVIMALLDEQAAARMQVVEDNTAILVAALGWAARRAEAASGYPGALDLIAAGIAPAEYAAMSDISLYLADIRD